MSNKKDNKIKKYDERGNLIYMKWPNGLEEWVEYDENNNRIHYKTSRGQEKLYDKNRNLIHLIDRKAGTDTLYDEYGNVSKITSINNNDTKYELTEEEYKEYIILKTYFEKLSNTIKDIEKELYEK